MSKNEIRTLIEEQLSDRNHSKFRLQLLEDSMTEYSKSKDTGTLDEIIDAHVACFIAFINFKTMKYVSEDLSIEAYKNALDVYLDKVKSNIIELYEKNRKK